MSKMSRLFFELQTLYEEEIANEYHNRKGDSPARESQAPSITACGNGNWRQLFTGNQEAQPVHGFGATGSEVPEKESAEEIFNSQGSCDRIREGF